MVVMIPYLPVNSTDVDTVKFYTSIVENLEIRSGHHESWHSHKRDPSVCWMCDLVEVGKLLIHEMERYMSKSSLDIVDKTLVQEFNSEEDTDNYNHNEESINGNSRENTL